MVGEVADVDPLAPRLARLPHLVGGFVERLRRRVLRPTQRDEYVVALRESGACACFVALEADAQIGGQPQRRVRLRVLARARDGLAVCCRGVLPRRTLAVVVERGLAAHHQFHDAADTSHGAEQDVLGIPIHRSAAVRARPGVQVVPGPHHQRVAHDEPPRVRLPRRLEDQAARQVPPGSRDRHAVGPEPEVARTAVEDRPEHAGGVGARHAHPLDRPCRRDEAGVLAVGEERVVGDRGERIPQPTARDVRDGSGDRERCRRFDVAAAVLAGAVRGLGVLQDHAAHHRPQTHPRLAGRQPGVSDARRRARARAGGRWPRRTRRWRAGRGSGWPTGRRGAPRAGPRGCRWRWRSRGPARSAARAE